MGVCEEIIVAGVAAMLIGFVIRQRMLSQRIDSMLYARGFDNIGLYARDKARGMPIRVSFYGLDPVFPDKEIYQLACQYDRVLKRFFWYLGAVLLVMIGCAVFVKLVD